MRAYDKSIFHLSENFVEIVFPYEEEYLRLTEQVTEQVAPEVTPEVEKLIRLIQGEMSRLELQVLLGLKDEKHFREYYQQKSLKLGILEMTIPDKPKSRFQKYRLTAKGMDIKKQLEGLKYE